MVAWLHFFSFLVVFFLVLQPKKKSRANTPGLRLEDKKINKVEDKGVKEQAGREKDQPDDSILAPLINQSQEERSGGKGFQSERHKAGKTQNRHLKNAAKVKIR